MNDNSRTDFPLSPHLIFNTLSFIYNSVLGVSPKAAYGVMLLSDVLRYSIRPASEDGKVYLHEEIAQINNIIELNQIRFNGRLFVQTEIKTIPSSPQRIIPFILATLVENVFKHGYLQDGNRPAEVKLKEEEGLLFLSTSNMKRPSMYVSESGIGKREVVALLEQHYKNKYQLHVTETNTHYLLKLKLRL